MAFLEVKCLSKEFHQGLIVKKKVEALKNISLQLDLGEILALVGSNGSGKTTFLKILSTLIYPTSGTVSLNQVDMVKQSGKFRNLISLVTNDDRSFFWRLTCYDNLQFFSTLNNLSKETFENKVYEISDALKISDYLETRFDRCSTGIKRKLSLARALLKKPKLLLLDEPGNSLDKDSHFFLKEMILRETNEENTMVIYVTHQLSELEGLPCKNFQMDNGTMKIMKHKCKNGVD